MFVKMEEFHVHETELGWKGVEGVSFRDCFSTLPIAVKIKFLYQRTAKEILGTYFQNERFSSPRARASNV